MRSQYIAVRMSAFRNKTEEERGLAAIGGEGKHSRGARVEASILENDLDIGKAVTIPATMRGTSQERLVGFCFCFGNPTLDNPPATNAQMRTQSKEIEI
jgi:hypothetical protein